MKYIYIILLFLLKSTLCLAQENQIKEVDSLYKEDQFYAGVTYNLFGDKPNDLNQNGFSLGFHIGFIKDMPINKNRDLAIGLGIGYSVNSYNQDLLINQNSFGGFTYNIIENTNTFSKNTFTNHLIEIPLEFRWRTSTASDYSFWRIYTGIKVGYLFNNKSNYKGDLGHLKYTNNKDFNALQYGLTLSAGYNTWNFFLYYGLNPIFSKDVKIDTKNLNINAIKIGLMFYIL